MSTWADLPRRLTTISIAVPIILSILSHPKYARYLIQVSHLICTIEWIRLIPKAENKFKNDDTGDTVSFTGNNDMSSKDRTTRHCDRRNFINRKESLSTKKIEASTIKKINLSFRENFHKIVFVFLSLYLGTPSSSANSPSFSLLLPFISMCLTITLPRHIATHFIHGFLFLSLGYYHLHLIYQDSVVHAIQFLFVVWNSDTGALLFGRTWKGDPIGHFLNAWGITWMNSLRQISSKKSVTGMGE